MSAVLRVQDLSVALTTPHGVVNALRDVSLTLDQGECLGLVGESGSGKSLLGRTLMQLLPPIAVLGSASRIEYDGRDLLALSAREKEHLWGPEISMVFQDPMTSLNPVRTIGAQLTDPLRRHLGMSRKQARRRGEDLLRNVGLSDVTKRMTQFPHELSGGMRQRVVIAVAIACGPKVLVADEPTTALDVTVQRQILDLLKRLQVEEGMAMILVSHDIGLVAEYADRVSVMYAGELVETAPSSVLESGARHRYTDALLRSTPTLTMVPHQRIDTIAGRPPNMSIPIPGCAFAPRCEAATEVCHVTAPAQTVQGEGCAFRCHHPLDGVELEDSEGER